MNPPRTRIKIGVGFQILSALVIYALLNHLAFVHYERIDVSRSQKFALAAQTKTVLKEFKQPLHIIVICSPTFASPASALLRDLQNLLTELLFNKREGLVVEYVDPTRNITRVEELKTKFNLSNIDDLIILEHDARHRLVNIIDTGDFDFSGLSHGAPPVLLSFRGEQSLTAAMIPLLKPDTETVAFLQGHGEPDPSRQLSTLTSSIANQNARVQPLSLASTDSVPPEVSALVIAAAKSDLDERESAILSAWLRSGGRMLVLLDPNASTPNLHTLLASSGIVPRDDRVLRLIQLPFATGILRDVTGEVLQDAEITRRLEGMNILFPGATQSLGVAPEIIEKEKIRIRPLVQPAEEFWGEVNYAPNQPDGVRYDDGIDHGQPLVIAASADRNAVEDDRVKVQSSRLIVIGSSQFAYDASLTPQGLDLLVGSINSLINRSNVSGITPKTSTRFLLQLTEDQLSRLALVVMVAMPGAAAFLGLIVWLRRRA